MKHNRQSLGKQFCNGLYVPHVDARLWQDMFAYLAAVDDTAAFQSARIQALWYQYGGDLRAMIKDDALITGTAQSPARL